MAAALETTLTGEGFAEEVKKLQAMAEAHGDKDRHLAKALRH